MAAVSKRKQGERLGRTVADNRRARFNYAILETFEAGIALAGTEVKALREGAANIRDAYARDQGGELYLLNAYIPEYQKASRFNHETRRPRKLLMHRREIARLIGSIQRKGLTLVPLRIYFNDKGRAKVELALAQGKKLHDKRAAEKERTWQRERARVMRENA